MFSLPPRKPEESKLSRLARLDLIEISDYTQDTWGEEQADRYLDSLEALLPATRSESGNGPIL